MANGFSPDFLTNGAILITTELIKMNGKANNDGFTATCVSCEFFPRCFSCVFNSFRCSRWQTKPPIHVQSHKKRRRTTTTAECTLYMLSCAATEQYIISIIMAVGDWRANVRFTLPFLHKLTINITKTITYGAHKLKSNEYFRRFAFNRMFDVFRFYSVPILSSFPALVLTLCSNRIRFINIFIEYFLFNSFAV